jgi:FHA domain
MAVTCPAGHESTTTDYCDTCGAPIGAASAPESAGAPAGEAAGGTAVERATQGAGDGETGAEGAATGPAVTACPGCGEPVTARFCESCGYDVESGTPAGPAPVTLVLGTDRAHWDRMVGSGEPAFPAVAPTLSFELSGDRAVLGRVRSGASTGDIDLALTGTAADPAISHHQCVFERDGATWTVRDAGSANGTWVNDATEPLAGGAAHTLAPGDRILMGAWTCLTVRTGAPPSPAEEAASETSEGAAERTPGGAVEGAPERANGGAAEPKPGSS